MLVVLLKPPNVFMSLPTLWAIIVKTPLVDGLTGRKRCSTKVWAQARWRSERCRTRTWAGQVQVVSMINKLATMDITALTRLSLLDELSPRICCDDLLLTSDHSFLFRYNNTSQFAVYELSLFLSSFNRLWRPVRARFTSLADLLPIISSP